MSIPFRIHISFILLTGTIGGSLVFLIWDWARPSTQLDGIMASARIAFRVDSKDEWKDLSAEIQERAYSDQLQIMKEQAKSRENIADWYRLWREPKKEQEWVLESLASLSQYPDGPFSTEDLLLTNRQWETEEDSPLVRVGFQAPEAEIAIRLTRNFVAFLTNDSKFSGQIEIVDLPHIDGVYAPTLMSQWILAALRGAAIGLTLAVIAVLFRCLFSKKHE